jgi:peptide/nickel transport system substrate-binding protein
VSSSHRNPDGEAMGADGVSRRRLLQGAAAGGMTLALGGALAACGSDDGATTGASTAAGEGETVRRGGRLRVGMIGGGNTETLNFNLANGEIDTARGFNLFEGITDFDPDGKTFNLLAEELEPNEDASVWTLRLRDDVVFHDGKQLGAEDVLYSLRYMLDPKNKAQGGGALGDLDGGNMRRRDALTVELPLKRPNAFLPDVLGDRTVKIFADGSDFERPNGTGPFKFESWKRGERSLFVRHDDYRDGKPHLDELELISINDPNSRVSALQSGQIDALSQLDLTLVDAVSADPNVQLLEKVGGNHTALYVQCNADPFTNNDIRQALRYAIDRQQVVDNALRGKGRIGNDLPCFFDQYYANDIPQREYDPEMARSLLKKAGAENLSVTLHTADTAPAMLESSTLFVEHAKAAGINVRIRRYPTDSYFSVAYDKVPFGATNWSGRPLSSMINIAFLKKAPFNETRFFDDEFEQVIADAFAASDEARRTQLMTDAQQILWDRGGTIVWGFLPIVDAVTAKVRGITPSVIRSMGNYDFRNAWLAA